MADSRQRDTDERLILAFQLSLASHRQTSHGGAPDETMDVLHPPGGDTRPEFDRTGVSS